MGHSAGLSRDEMHYLGYSNIPEREEVHIMVDQKKIVCGCLSLFFCFFLNDMTESEVEAPLKKKVFCGQIHFHHLEEENGEHV